MSATMFPRSRRVGASLDMAPLIDVVFLLLIFFMLTSSFTEPAVPLDLPAAGGMTTPPAGPVTVSVDASGVVSIDGEVVPRASFPVVLAKKLGGGSDRTVNFRGERAMPYETFVTLLEEARRVGAEKFNIVHEQAVP